MELIVSIHINYLSTLRNDLVGVRYDLWYKGSLISFPECSKLSNQTHPWKDLLIALFKWKPHASLKIHLRIPREYRTCHMKNWLYYSTTRVDCYCTENRHFDLIIFSETVEWIINRIRALDSNPPNVRVSLLECEQQRAGVGWTEDGKPARTFNMFRPYEDYELILLPFLRLRKCEFHLPEDLRKMISDDLNQSEHSNSHSIQSDWVGSGQWRHKQTPTHQAIDTILPFRGWIPTEDNWWRLNVSRHDALRIHKGFLDVRAMFHQYAAQNSTFEYNYRAFLNEDLSSLSIPVDFDDGNIFYQTNAANSVIQIIDGPPDCDGSFEVESMQIPEADSDWPKTDLELVISESWTRSEADTIVFSSRAEPQFGNADTTLEKAIMSKMDRSIEYTPDYPLDRRLLYVPSYPLQNFLSYPRN